MRKSLSAFLVSAAAALGAAAATVAVDPSAKTGPVKPVNGVGQPPIIGCAQFPMFRYLKEAGIPYSRLHDVGGMFGRGVFVDIPNLFRDFDADETKPENYDFAFTDGLISALLENGVEPFFRLGVTIENYTRIKRYRIDPPKDFAKWARICEHVIRHYTEGWADGFTRKIEYWEIWNEPENRETPETNEMWAAPFSEYCRLYETASKHLKAKFPHLKIGGYASCGLGGALAENPSPRSANHLKCVHEFLAFVRDRKCPLDYFSYHSYADVPDMLRQIDVAEKLLAQYGFAGLETWLNEWLPKPKHEKLGTALQAAEVAAALAGFQNSPLDAACIYDARCGVGNYSPLFNPLTYEPHKAYYAFTAFNELRKLGDALAVKADCPPGVYATAAGGPGGAKVLLANISGASVPLECRAEGMEIAGCRITDGTRTWEEAAWDGALPAESFCVLTLRPAR